MRTLSFVASLAVSAFLVACGSSGPSGFNNGGGDGSVDNDAGYDPDGDPFATQDANAETRPPCQNLQCQQVTCQSGKTTVSGKVYDPGSKRGLYNVFVYVPNAPTSPFTAGVTCTACQAPASGNPVVSATTGPDGTFVLNDVPVGTNIPIVLQLGKWRRQLTIPAVTACQDNPQPDKSLRLPKNHSEGDIPLLALTTGCDQAECFLVNTVGLDPGEITGPSGSGRVHIYRGQDESQGLPASPGQSTALWGNLTTMKKYDIVFDACECSTYDRGTPQGYTNMKAYLDGGGRMFGTHYFYNFFANMTQCGGYDSSCQGPADFSGVAEWMQSKNLPGPYYINTTLPKGKAMADWYKGIKPSSTYGQLPLVDTRNDVHRVTAGKATPWLYTGDLKSSYDSYYLSFNAPVPQPVANQCGKAVFSDVHLVGLMNNYSQAWPASCAGGYNGTDHSDDELALEFLFFDLSSCVQDETQPPPPPPN